VEGWDGGQQFLDAETAWITLTLNQDASFSYKPIRTSLVFHTTDSGKSWQKTVLQTNGKQVRYLVFINATDGWLMTGSESATHVVTGPEKEDQEDLFHTTDGGKTWVKILEARSAQASLFTDVYIEGMSFADTTTGVITGVTISRTPTTVLFVTHDGGTTWQQQNLPTIPGLRQTPKQIGKAQFFTPKEGLIGATFNNGEDMIVYTTRDAGFTWQSSPVLHRKSASLQPSSQSFGIPQFIDMQHGWLAGSDPVLYTTTDGGQHWTQVYPGKDHSLNSLGILDFVSAQTAWSIRYLSDQKTHAQTTVLYKTSDGGPTWTQVHAIFPDFIMPESAFHQ
jgi:photosystem II stability/assembly factor-like uncharacterized protein